MKIYDVFVIGGGKSGTKIGSALAIQGKKIGLLEYPDGREDRHLRALETLDRILDPSIGMPARQEAPPAKIDKFRGTGHFIDPQTFEIKGEPLQAKRFVIAAGSVTLEPNIPGLTKCPYETAGNWDGASLSETAAVLGAGPLGVSTALALTRKKVQPTLLSSTSRLLIDEDEETSAAAEAVLKSNGGRIYKNVRVREIKSGRPKKVILHLESHGERFSLQVQTLFLAAGAASATAELSLDKAGVFISKDQQIVTNETMATSNPKIFALGPVAGTWHAGLEDLEGEFVLNNLTAPFFSKKRLELDHWPFSFPFSPSFARIGLTEIEAAAKYSDARVLTHFFPEKHQFLKIIGRKKTGEILGVHCLGSGARELILYFDLARRADISLFDLSDKQHAPAPGRTAEVVEAVLNWAQSSRASHSV